MQVIQLIGSTMGLASVAGLNLYASVVTVGLGIRFGFIQLPPDLAALSVLAHPYVLIAAGGIYIIEFFADKIPSTAVGKPKRFATILLLITPIILLFMIGIVMPLVFLLAILLTIFLFPLLLVSGYISKKQEKQGFKDLLENVADVIKMDYPSIVIQEDKS